MSEGTDSATGLGPGHRLDRYEILFPLAVGGMGEIYRARDHRLQRDVAVKVLPSSLSTDPERLRRFEREARAAGSLDHPNVLVVHDVGTHEGTPYLVTELLDGQTLRERMQSDPLPVRKCLEIAVGLARGLAAAHDKSIIHRDLKPDNVFITRDGRVKILDFGLAKVTAPQGVDTEAQTLVSGARLETVPGHILGTAGYMSPEQVRGEPADPRSDIFALGVVLYEMLWDRRAFARGSKVETLGAILWEDPLDGSAPATVPPPLQDVVRRCLEKDPAERFQSARDLGFALEALASTSEDRALEGLSARAPVARPSRRRVASVLQVAIGALLGGGLALGGRAALERPPPRIGDYRSLVGGLSAPPMSWATDGERVYYTVTRDGHHGIEQLPMAGGEPSPVDTPFEQAIVLDASPRTSALLVLGWDGGLTDWESRDQALWVLPVPAGGARNTGLKAHAAAWSRDGRRLAFSGGSDDYNEAAPGSIHVASSDGSDARLLWTGTTTIPWLRWSPDGERLRFGAFDRDRQEWWIHELTTDGKSEPGRVAAGERGAWSADGRYFLTGRWSAPGASGLLPGEPRFDLLALPGRPADSDALGEDARRLTAGPLDFAGPTFSPDGRQLVVAGTLRRMELLRYSASSGGFERVPDVPGGFVEHSRDGQFVAWVDPSSMTLWRSRSDGTGRLQLTVPPMAVGLFRWSPDGARLLFVADPTGGRQPRAVYLVSRDGGRLESFSDPNHNPVWDPCWLDGETVAWGNLRGDGSAIWTVSLSTGSAAALPGSPGMMGPKCAADGAVLAAKSWTEGYWLYRPGQGWKDLGQPSDLWYPTFSRDGSAIYGLSLDERAIFRFGLSGGRRVRIAELGTLQPTAPWQEVWMGLDPTDAPLILRSTGFSDLFALQWLP